MAEQEARTLEERAVIKVCNMAPLEGKRVAVVSSEGRVLRVAMYLCPDYPPELIDRRAGSGTLLGAHIKFKGGGRIDFIQMEGDRDRHKLQGIHYDAAVMFGPSYEGWPARLDVYDLLRAYCGEVINA